ncbi:hypothetical protein PR048_009131 [Dryococelus australis]|uniref:Reverse transcriptase n=1 Tax=Dryococelus australis TaxID=614101 RepID=A0ABQ9HZ17_9NEOP|nr:hypothetical protein PR048_009131 [Dryococelus australis]
MHQRPDSSRNNRREKLDIDIQKLEQNDRKEDFMAAIQNRFAELVIRKVLETGRSKNKKTQHWFNEECKEKTEMRKAARKKWLTDKNNEELVEYEHPWVENPTMELVKNVIRPMKRRNAMGIDSINAEILQVGKEIVETKIPQHVMYGAKLWTLIKIIKYKLTAFENEIPRKIFGPVKGGDEELINLYQLRVIVAVINGQRLRWYGHIMRRDGDLVKDVVERCFEEKRPCGRSKLRWLDPIKEDIRKADISEEEWRDRALWRKLVAEETKRLRSVMPMQ